VSTRKTKEQLLQELEALRTQVAALERSEAERDHAEAALKRSESRYRSILESIEESYYEVDLAGNFTFFNNALCGLLGYTREELTGKNYRHYTPENRVEDVYAAFNQVYQTGEGAKAHSWEVMLKNGSRRVVEVSVSLVRAEEDEPVGFRGVVRDVTDRVQAEQSLSESALRLDGIVSAATDAIITVNQAQAITLFNTAAERLFGYAAPEVLGKPMNMLIPQQFREAHTGHIREFGRSGKTARTMYDPGVVYGQRADGTEFPIEALISQVVVSGDRLYTVILRDISERFLIEQAERARRTLAESLRDTAAALNSTLDLEEVLNSILASAGRVVPHDAADVMLVDPGTNTARIVRQHGYADLKTSRKESALVHSFSITEVANLRRMVETNLPLTIANLHADKEWLSFAETSWARSYVGAPIRLEGKVIGFLSLMNAKPDYYTDTHAGQLQAFADQAAVAIKNARLYEQVQHHAAQLEALHRVTLDITAELDLKALLEALAKTAFELLNAQSGGVYLYEPERDLIRWTVGVGSGLAPIGTTLKRGEGISGRVWESGKPLVVQNYAQWEGRAESYAGYDFPVVLGVPIHWSDEFLGVINATADDPSKFSEQEAELLGLFADQAAVAIKNARLYQEVRGHADQLEALRRVTLDTTAELDLDALLEALAMSAFDLLGAEGGGVYLYDSERDVLVWSVGIGPSTAPIGTEFKRGEGVSGRVLESGKLFMVENYAQWEGRSASYEEYDPGTVLGVPIHWGDELLGVINANSPDPAKFSEREVELLSLFAAQAAIAIHNARLFEDVRQHADQLEALHRVALDITAELDLDALLNTIVEAALKLMGVQRGGIYIYRPDRDALEWMVRVGPGMEPIGSILRRGESVSGRVWESGKPLIVNDYATWEGRFPPYEPSEWTAAMSVPIHWGEEFLGVVSAVDVKEERTFSERDADLLSLFSAQAAIAINNARLYEDIRRHAEKLEERVAERTAELGAAYVNLKRLTEVKDEFVSNVSHELRTPIANFKLYHALLEKASPEKFANHLGVLQRETDRLEHIIENLLRLSRLDQGQADFHPVLVDLNVLASQYVADRTPLAKSQGLSLRLELQPDLPLVQADEGLLGQVLSILLSNAMNYTPEGGRVAVRTKTKKGEQEDDIWVGLHVKDSGPGIPSNERPRLFERFFRGNVGRKSGVPGTGLGLAIAKEIVLRHGGRIEVDDEGIARKGATFSVWLPSERE
jgi:PAS domain S-box-containing protein